VVRQKHPSSFIAAVGCFCRTAHKNSVVIFQNLVLLCMGTGNPSTQKVGLSIGIHITRETKRKEERGRGKQQEQHEA
jgi:hypothetical protein